MYKFELYFPLIHTGSKICMHLLIYLAKICFSKIPDTCGSALILAGYLATLLGRIGRIHLN